MASDKISDFLEYTLPENTESIPNSHINEQDSLKFHKLVYAVFDIINRPQLLERYQPERFDQNEYHHFDLPDNDDAVKKGIKKRTNRRPDICSNYTVENGFLSYDVSISSPFVCEIQNVTLFGPNAIGRTPDGKILLETAGNDKILLTKAIRHTIRECGLRNTIKYGLGSQPEPDAEFETAISLVRCASSFKSNRLSDSEPTQINYGHWMLEELPKLRVAEYYHSQTGNMPTILIDPNPPTWLPETLRLLGYSEDQWTEWNHSCSKVQNLVLPRTSLIGSFNFEPLMSNYRWLRDRIIKNIDYEQYKKDFSDRVIISRRKVDRRRVENIENILENLKHHGFKEYHPEKMSLKKQIALFENADIIISPFGANQANLLFAENAHVIELFPHGFFSPLFFEIISESNLTYSYIIGNRRNNSQVGKNGRDISNKNNDIFVNTANLKSMIYE